MGEMGEVGEMGEELTSLEGEKEDSEGCRIASL
jgi:hypothetical protein